MRPQQQDLHYFSVSITTHERKVEPYTLTQTQIHQGYAVHIALADGIDTLIKKDIVLPLFFNALKEAFANEKSFKISSDNEITLFTQNTHLSRIEKWLSILRNFECDAFCEKSNISLVAGDMFYQGSSVEYNSLVLLTSALIQEMHTALKELTLTERQQKEFKGPSLRW